MPKPGSDSSSLPYSNSEYALTVILQHGEWRNILTYPGTMFALKPEHLDMEYLASSRHFHMSSYFLQHGLHEKYPSILAELKSCGLSISLDTNDDPNDTWQAGLERVLPFVDVLMPNEREAKKLSGCDTVDAAISRLLEVVPLVVVKRGFCGATAGVGSKR